MSSEKDPEEDTVVISLEVDGSEVRGTPDNMSLILHRLGSTMLNGVEVDNDQFDCILYDENEDDPEAASACFFRGVMENFDEVAEAMLKYDFPCHFNIRKVSETVLEVYGNYVEAKTSSVVEQTDFDSELEELLGRGEDDICDGE